MIGDGANDCAAIKQADVGMSFGNTDAGYSASFSNSGSDSLDMVVFVLLVSKGITQNIIDTIKLYLFGNVFKQLVFNMIVDQSSVFGDFQSKNIL